MITTCTKHFIFVAMLFSFATTSYSRDHLIYSVSRDLPMGYDNEVIRSNYYINMGKSHGLSKGTVLNVFRNISKENPYDNKKRIIYQVKIGELKVIHTDETAAITEVNKVLDGEHDPIFSIGKFMIGDTVSVNMNY